MTTMSYVCALRHRLSVWRVCFMLACVLHSFLDYMSLVTSRSLSPLFVLVQPPRLRRISTVERQQHRSARTRPTGRCVHRPEPSGLGLMRRGLFEGAWLGSQALRGATAFNANIGAWNTASMTTMASVCALCHRPACAECVLRACLCASLISRVLVCHRPWRIKPAALHACVCRASLISRVLLCAHSDSTQPLSGLLSSTAAAALHLDGRAPAHRSARTL
jgi:hypothetical protein